MSTVIQQLAILIAGQARFLTPVVSTISSALTFTDRMATVGSLEA